MKKNYPSYIKDLDLKLPLKGLTEEEKTKFLEISDALYDLYKNRLKTKHYTKEAYRFEREATTKIARYAYELMKRTWNISGYFPFEVFNPHRVINAPAYGDRIVEQYMVENAFKPTFIPQIHEYSLACQEGKGPLLAQDYIKYALSECWEMYGGNFYILQFDIEKFFDAISHSAAKAIFQEIGEDWFWIYDKIIDSFSVDDKYAALNDPDNPHGYGVPKGNLPSQWTGIMILNGMITEISEDPACIFDALYMDDGLIFCHEKRDCKRIKKWIEQFLECTEMGFRLHPIKTQYFPVSRRFTFCGRHYTLDNKTGKVTIKIKNERKKYMESRRRNLSHLVAENKVDILSAEAVKEGQNAYLNTGMASGRLIHYMEHHYPLPEYPLSKKEKERIKKKHAHRVPDGWRTRRDIEKKIYKAYPPIGSIEFR